MKEKYISESGFYDISSYKETNLIVGKNTHVIFFDSTDNVKKIVLEQGSQLEYFSLFSVTGDYSKHIITQGEKSKSDIHSFILAGPEENITAKVVGEVGSNNSKIDTDIVSIVETDGKVDLDGIIQINENLEKTEGYLDEINIFLGERGSIRGFPTLLVRSNDVQAGHSCKIEKISDEKLFYLRSRGMKKEDALYMMLVSYIESIFGKLEKYEKDFHDLLITEIMKKIRL
ncbi:MAG: SufD family Fe-S cluster assembly protein [Candidatus Gracilibacteria bacterium]|nr:SufD family Fe-S cluster assembly protein [Candidatus Gracilibacteria bacterium]